MPAPGFLPQIAHSTHVNWRTIGVDNVNPFHYWLEKQGQSPHEVNDEPTEAGCLVRSTGKCLTDTMSHLNVQLHDSGPWKSQCEAHVCGVPGVGCVSDIPYTWGAL